MTTLHLGRRQQAEMFFRACQFNRTRFQIITALLQSKAFEVRCVTARRSRPVPFTAILCERLQQNAAFGSTPYGDLDEAIHGPHHIRAGIAFY